MWFSDEAIAALRAEPRTIRGRQPWHSPLAILKALTLHALFRLAFRRTEDLIGSIIGLLGLALRVPDHTTLSRRAATLDVPWPSVQLSTDGEAEPLHLLVDSTGLNCAGLASSWSRNMAPARAGRGGSCIWVSTPTLGRSWPPRSPPRRCKTVPKSAPFGQVDRAMATFAADGGYNQDGVYANAAQHHPDAVVIVPPRTMAVPSATAESAFPLAFVSYAGFWVTP